jgi:uncharacterized membrane protein
MQNRYCQVKVNQYIYLKFSVKKQVDIMLLLKFVHLFPSPVIINQTFQIVVHLQSLVTLAVLS